MPSFKDITGIIATFVILSVASGHGEYVWKSIAYMRYHALSEARKPWGCPSIFESKFSNHKGSACTELRLRH